MRKGEAFEFEEAPTLELELAHGVEELSTFHQMVLLRLS
jgi:hypothetical protein